MDADLAQCQALGRLKRGALLVNVARGDLVDTAALVAALRDGQIAAAAHQPITQTAFYFPPAIGSRLKRADIARAGQPLVGATRALTVVAYRLHLLHPC